MVKNNMDKVRSLSTNKNKVINVNPKTYLSENLNINSDINLRCEVISKLKKEYKSLEFNDELFENKKKYDDFFPKL